MKHHWLKDMAAVFVIFILLPYVVTILLFGFPEKSSKKHESAEKSVRISYGDVEKELTFDEYLIGVLAAEIPVDYQMEALKAQAVLARTYYVKHEKEQDVINQENSAQTFLTESQMKELWGSQFEEKYRKLEQAVMDTNHECMYYKDELSEPFFHAESAGKTRDGKEFFGNEDYAYLRSCVCEKDLQADNCVTMKTFTKEELCEYLTQFHNGAGIEQMDKPLDVFQIASRDEAGYVTKMNIAGESVHGEILRSQLNLPSSAFQIEEWESGIRFVCKGMGHGLGMSLYTANQMAKEGKSYQEILGFFFYEIVIQ